MAPLLGHGPFLGERWPTWLWRKLFYDSRPDLHRSKTRPPQWAMVRSEWRFFNALFCYLGPPSHILWNIKWPWLSIMIVTALAYTWDHDYLVHGDIELLDPDGIINKCYPLSSFAMSLLLAFRVTQTYYRWRDARAAVSGMAQGTLAIFMQAVTWIEDPVLVEDFRRYCIVWQHSVKMILVNSPVLEPVAADLLYPQELALFAVSKVTRQLAATKIRQLAHDAQLSIEQFICMDGLIQYTWQRASDAMRVNFQAMPQGLSMLCTGFIFIWLMLLPFSLIPVARNTERETDREYDWIVIWVMAIVSMLLLACDEIAAQMELPFDLMPLDDIFAIEVRNINNLQDEAKAIRAATIEGRRDVAALSQRPPAASSGRPNMKSMNVLPEDIELLKASSTISNSMAPVTAIARSVRSMLRGGGDDGGGLESSASLRRVRIE